MKVMRQRATLIGFTVLAFLMMLVFIYAALKDVVEIWPLLLKTLPMAAVAGAVIGLLYFAYARWRYNKERHS